MIECSTENIWYKRRQRFSLKRLLTFFFVVLFVVGIFLYFNIFVVKKIYKICEDYAYTFSTESVNEAVIESLSISSKYSEFVNIEKNSDGNIILMTTNSQKVNLINREIALETEKKLKNKLATGVPIPLLTFLGVDILSGYGPNIWYKPVSVVSVICSFDSNFESVGINQTLHSIYIEVISNVKIESAFNYKIKECKNKILISETVLVGKVPDSYLNGKMFG